jgi:hypothetical protein
VLAQVSPSPVGTHPAWHFAAVAGGAVLVFLAIKAKEGWDHHASGVAGARRTNDHANGSRRPRPSGPVVALAIASAGAAATHAAVGPVHFREAAAFGVFFALAAASQAGWAVLLLLRPTRRLLVVGAVGNAGVLALWALTRTIGLPIGPEAWRPEAIGAADALAAQLEIAITLGASWLLFRSAQSVRVITRPQGA